MQCRQMGWPDWTLHRHHVGTSQLLRQVCLEFRHLSLEAPSADAF